MFYEVFPLRKHPYIPTLNTQQDLQKCYLESNLHEGVGSPLKISGIVSFTTTVLIDWKFMIWDSNSCGISNTWLSFFSCVRISIILGLVFSTIRISILYC